MISENNKTNYPLLEKINSPRDLRTLTEEHLKILATELREYIIETVRKTGGHLAPSLGVVELTIALHKVFQTPTDKLVWDVGHQAYGHKILTGRREAIKTIRQFGGISGFCKRTESEYDVFGAGHASTSISAAVGLAVARELAGRKERIVSVIGDGALTGGLAYEGLNNIDNIKGQFLVILNDNEMSISRNVGAMSNYLTRIITSPQYLNFRNQVWNSLTLLPKGTSAARKFGRKMVESLKNFLAPGILFEEFGFRYYGPVDGHDLPQLITTLNNIKDLGYPVLLHVITQKGRGLAIAEKDPTKYHGIGPVKKVATPNEEQTEPFLNAFGKIACELADRRKDLVFITAAMCDGTGLVEYRKKFPERYFDVGIAEAHAVTFSGGLTVAGLRPIVAIYSTFLQRAYDQIIHDIALQKLPVVFALDRAGLVGADGPTHHGAFDLSYLNTVPNMIVAAPRDGNELRDLLYTAVEQDSSPFAIRYPKASFVRFNEGKQPQKLPIGKWEVLHEGRDIAVVSAGVMTNVVMDSLQKLRKKDLEPTIVHARFVKPLDIELLADLAARHRYIVTVEENILKGGFGQNITHLGTQNDWNTSIITLGIPDEFVPHGSRDILLKNVGLDAESIAARIISLST